ncbi:hypothetical protein BST85_13445 [Aureitalea marina]|uniref:Uncharacterized protein n=1 Tax=Aureitalea marina TaxID=930804 RepID=A0A2S7KT44_9FLAO|nr:hypothetical protein BST85_13445 [Aureitalea marina]
MKIIKNISQFLSKQIVQRILYGIALIFWLWVFSDSFRYYNSESSIGIKYLWLIAIPSALLTAQIVFNNKVIWGIIVGLVSIYSIWTLWQFFHLNILIEYHKDYIPKNNWPLNDIIWFLIFSILFVVVNWVVWKLKPSKKHFA